MVSEAEPTDNLVNPDDEIFYNPLDMIEAFDSYFKKTGQSKLKFIHQYIACAYNSLGLSFAYFINTLEELTQRKYEVVNMIGGGCQSEHLCRTAANYSQKQVFSGPVECATIGNILVQGITLGKIKDINSGRVLVENSFPVKLYKPEMDENQSKHMYQKFIKLKTIEDVR